jgi:hypothetical protein
MGEECTKLPEFFTMTFLSRQISQEKTGVSWQGPLLFLQGADCRYDSQKGGYIPPST